MGKPHIASNFNEQEKFRETGCQSHRFDQLDSSPRFKSAGRKSSEHRLRGSGRRW
jgi:hypothetical protein